MQAENLYELLSAKLSGEATEAELRTLEQYLDLHPDEKLQVEIFENIWKERNLMVTADSKTAFDKHLTKLKGNTTFADRDAVINKKTKVVSIRRTLLRVSAVAAAIILALSVYLFTYEAGNNRVVEGGKLQVVTTKYGSKKKLRLPDGTQVWLNSGSTITYNNQFSNTSREVRLSGEAFFDVVKDAERPFVIHTQILDVKVLGTAFNLRSYPDERTTETALMRGRVQIILHENPEKKLFLNPNDKVIIQNPISDKNKAGKTTEAESKIMLAQVHQLKQASTTMETSWMSNKLTFDNETLEQIALKLERWFDVKVNIQDETLKSATYYGVFEDENLDDVLTALRLTGNFHFKISDQSEVVIIP